MLPKYMSVSARMKLPAVTGTVPDDCALAAEVNAMHNAPIVSEKNFLHCMISLYVALSSTQPARCTAGGVHVPSMTAAFGQYART